MFASSSRNFSCKLISSGSVHEAQEIRQTRTDINKDVKEILMSINFMLNELGLEKESTFRCDESVRSGFLGFDLESLTDSRPLSVSQKKKVTLRVV